MRPFKCFKGHIVTKKLTNVVMVTWVPIVKDQNAIHTLNVTTVFVKMSKYQPPVVLLCK